MQSAPSAYNAVSHIGENLLMLHAASATNSAYPGAVVIAPTVKPKTAKKCAEHVTT